VALNLCWLLGSEMKMCSFSFHSLYVASKQVAFSFGLLLSSRIQGLQFILWGIMRFKDLEMTDAESVDDALAQALDRCGMRGPVIVFDIVGKSAVRTTGIDDFIAAVEQAVEGDGDGVHLVWHP